jgi:signal transduction histidine kinase
VPSLLEEIRLLREQLDGPERFIDVALALRREKTQETLLWAGGRWDRLERRFLDHIEPDTVVVIDLEESQTGFTTWFAEFLADFRDGYPRDISAALVAGDQRAGKTFDAYYCQIAALIDVPFIPRTRLPALGWTVSKTFRERDELDELMAARIPRDWYHPQKAPEHRYEFVSFSTPGQHGPMLLNLSADDPDSLKRGKVDWLLYNEVQKMQARAVVNGLYVHLTGMDGYDTVAAIRQRERSQNVPVIFLTGIYDQPEHSHRGYALGAIDYVTKPFDAEIFRAKIRALVGLYYEAQVIERRRSEQQARLKDLFVGVLGHDLRSPLNAIVMAIETCSKDSSLPEKHRRAANAAMEASNRMQRMISDVLDLTRGQLGGGIPVVLGPIDLGIVCRSVVDECRLAHPDRKVLVDAEGNLRGRWDSDRLLQVVSNLVTNAIEHCTEDPIVVSVKDMGSSVVVEVRNFGRPIPASELATLFDPFSRGRATSGLGLGLYIVREIVRAHDGAAEVRSTPGEGTTFRITLPKSLDTSLDK